MRSVLGCIAAIFMLAVNASNITRLPDEIAAKLGNRQHGLDINKSVELMVVDWLGGSHTSDNKSIISIAEGVNEVPSVLILSTDQGVTFSKINLNEANLAAEIYKNEEFPDFAVLLSKDRHKLYFTRNAGTVWTPVDAKLPIREDGIIFNPNYPDYVLLLGESGELLYSDDFGGKLVDSHVEQVVSAYWPTSKDTPVSAKTVFYVRSEPPRASRGDKDMSLYKSTDLFKSSKRISNDRAFDFHIVDKYFFKTIINTIDKTASLFVSEDTINWNEAKFPVNIPVFNDNLSEVGKNADAVFKPGFEIIRVDQGAVFIKILSSLNSDRTGDLYVSDHSGIFYSLSLERNMHVTNTFTDFIQISSIPGVYLTNQIVKNGESLGAIRTVISFDKGGKWVPLTPPDFDSNGDEIDICDYCNLHLHNQLTESITKNTIQATYTDPKTPGLIISNGIVGESLNFKNTNLYVSLDGGVSWKESLKGSQRFSVGDRGGIIIAVPTSVSVQSSIQISKDFGESWSLYEFTKTPISIIRILSRPGAYMRSFTIWGSDAEGNWVVYSLDLTNIMDRECVNNSSTYTSESDYFKWSPSDGRLDHERCILGSTFTYLRRKHHAYCRNTVDIDTPEISKSPCQCAAEDFQCNYGFKRPHLSSECYPDENFIHTNNNTAIEQCSKANAKTYTIQSAYRKISGDTCINGVETTFPYTQEVTLDCPNYRRPAMTARKVIAKIMIVLSCAVLAFSAYLALALYRKKQNYWKRKYIALAQQEDHGNESGFGSDDNDDDYSMDNEESMILRTSSSRRPVTPAKLDLDFVEDDLMTRV